jgi:hypothetical protein
MYSNAIITDLLSTSLSENWITPHCEALLLVTSACFSLAPWFLFLVVEPLPWQESVSLNLESRILDGVAWNLEWINNICLFISLLFWPFSRRKLGKAEVDLKLRWILDFEVDKANLDSDCEQGPCQFLFSVCIFQGQQVLRAVIWQWWPAMFPMWLSCLGSVHRCQSKSNDPVDIQSQLKMLTWSQGGREADCILKLAHKWQSGPDPCRWNLGNKRAPNNWVNGKLLIGILCEESRKLHFKRNPWAFG